ncbi:RagB/SusD family nutrient uptake outer membrane protein [Sunxiuqinia elliptica]|uniref:Putative outer membrane starch-binding protein n=1 Tax=Sunxiuqinia elliptica TaxID=655355 RepID=A0A4R6HCC4_9BACT|nr:RagB/SusD family nutrient uptake outer membrane protein [Sunxiuqinia elliptica]TDO05355.1 putative outer membrane starch-binding protein [Sunxiuqinia elliptica]TDO64904.1 putative outer membrane starch-binding protein [Sunxiuqinia elliptica]
MNRQNKIKISILAVFLGFGLLSCDSELDLFPQNQYANDNFWTSETNAMLALTGVYHGAIDFAGTKTAPTDWWDYYGIILFEHASDNAYDRRGDNASYVQISNGRLLASNAYIKNFWVGSYKRVTICNNFLENIGNVEMDEGRKARMIAETRFVRACQYFYMAQFWESVPLVTTTLSPDEANVVTKASKSELINFVITELNDAVGDLPRYQDISADESGRASKQAALAFLGRTYLAEKRYSEAAQVYKQIMDYGDNIIDPDYASIFIEENETSAENIFSTKYTGGLAPNSVQQYAYPAILKGFHLINPTGDLAEEYEFIDGTPFSFDDPRYNSRNLAENRDPRFAYTFMWDGSDFHGKKYITHPDSASSIDIVSYSKQATRTGFGCRKYCDETYEGTLKFDYGGDVPIIRYAEVLLSYLEAKLEDGDAITQSLLDETINKVRGRESVNMPPVTQTNADLLRPLLRHERRVELAMEGIRYWDLKRWGIMAEKLNGDVWGAPYPDSEKYPTVSKKVDEHSRWYVTTREFREGQDEVWPIPESETNINPNLLN